MWSKGKEIRAPGGSSLSQLRSQIDAKYTEFAKKKSDSFTLPQTSVADPAAALDLLRKTRKISKKPLIKEAAADGSLVENAKVQEALKRKSEIYEELKRKPSARRSEHTLVDFEMKKLENEEDGVESDGSDNELVEVEDEFGRMRRVGKEEAKRIKGIHVNLADDYKEYSTRQQYGYHMVPPPQALGGSLETELAIRMKNEEAKEEWRNVLLRADDGIQGGDEHYNPDWELRNLGTGHYKFSQNEEIRRKQMEELRAAHQTTLSERHGVELTKQGRKIRMQERMAELRKAREQSQPRQQSVVAEPGPRRISSTAQSVAAAADAEKEAEQFLSKLLPSNN